MNKSISLNEVIKFLGNSINKLYGNTSDIVDLRYLRDSQNIDEYTLDWISNLQINMQQIAETSKAKVIVVGKGVVYSNLLKRQRKIIIVVENPKFSIAKIGINFFVDKPSSFIHPSAIIHPEANLGINVFIGANATIGKCKIGDNCFIYPNVTIYDRTTIGNNVSIHSGSVICVDGLGCMRLDDGILLEFPQLGGVIIEDDVYIGANTQIACGSLSNTIICKGSKINGLSFIGSNCFLGENTWITGSTMLAGSVTIGKDTTIYSRVVVREYCKIGEKVTIGMGSVVTKNIPYGETWFGTPAKKQEKYG